MTPPLTPGEAEPPFALTAEPPTDAAAAMAAPPSSPAYDVSAPGSDAGVPGRTRPRFEELPPGPPTWPGWSAIVLGALATLVGYATAVVAIEGSDANTTSMALGGGILVIAGAALVAIGLVWLAVAAILRRRVLPANRYRGPSLIALLAIVVIGGNLAAVPILLLVMGGDFSRIDDPVVITVELLLTPIAFLVVYALFVALPRALPGVRLWHGLTASLANLALGAVLGVLVWFGMGLLSELVNLLVQAVTGHQLGGEQAVVGLAQQVPLAIAVLTVAVLAPVAEELFFRGAVLNAWEREYGTSRALVGSSVLFALVHVVGGTLLAVAQVFLLGLILAAVYTRTRSLASTIGLHGAFNLASVLALFFLT